MTARTTGTRPDAGHAGPSGSGPGDGPVPAGPPRRAKVRKAATVLLFLAPSAVPLVLFTLVPMAGSLWVSLHEWNLIGAMRWTGLGNYAGILRDGDTWRALGNTTLYIAGYLPLVYVGGLGLAMALNRVTRGRDLFRAVYFLPVITSWVVVALIWKWLLNPSEGIVNKLLAVIGVEGPGWWTSDAWALPSVIIAAAWKDLGFVMVILLAGLQAVPAEALEAARVDGANAWQRFRHITLPLLSPSTAFVLVISCISGFQVFDQVYVMTSGGPAAAASEVMVERVYDLTFRYGRVGDASALSWVLFLVILLVTVVQVRLQRRWVNYG
ncbi:sugar ABC transporter permease [Sphaerisporangium album]|uniref:Sugar ABC transporter permease n=1 Tax=Sphaerisporangium album TaxID=509200 RepID=A0A367ETA9_9ACTN|nr:sugar ABC transporter permease [Sphaerisporangium album]RCG20969.1 sugar ABC transporter permease [Sphaerisporangium album]